MRFGRTAWTLNVIFAAAALVRIVLAFVNRKFNDDHLRVVRILIKGLNDGFQADFYDACSQCYHPKLFHYICAELFYHLGVSDMSRHVIIANLVSALAGIGTLYVVKLFLASRIRPARSLLFAVISFNPSLLKINVQATNDSLAIFLCVAVTYLLYRFLQTNRPHLAISAAVLCAAALLTKGNATALLAWLLVVLSIRLIQSVRVSAPASASLIGLGAAMLLAVVVLLIPPPLSTYGRYMEYLNARYRKAGPAFFLKSKNLNLFKPNYAQKTRLGVISIYDSYLTFPLAGLLEEPYITNGRAVMPPHRASLWAQIYGRLHFSFFDQSVWKGRDDITMAVGSGIMIAALLPTLLACAVLIWQTSKTLSQLFSSPALFVLRANWALPLLFTCYILMILQYTYVARSYTAMKDIYLMPALLSFVFGLMRLYPAARRRHVIVSRLLVANLAVLLLLYIGDMLLVFRWFNFLR